MVATYIKKDRVQYALCDSSVHQGRKLTYFWSIWCLGILKNEFSLSLRGVHRKCDKSQTLHGGTTH